MHLKRLPRLPHATQVSHWQSSWLAWILKIPETWSKLKGHILCELFTTEIAWNNVCAVPPISRPIIICLFGTTATLIKTGLSFSFSLEHYFFNSFFWGKTLTFCGKLLQTYRQTALNSHLDYKMLGWSGGWCLLKLFKLHRSDYHLYLERPKMQWHICLFLHHLKLHWLQLSVHRDSAGTIWAIAEHYAKTIIHGRYGAQCSISNRRRRSRWTSKNAN